MNRSNVIYLSILLLHSTVEVRKLALFTGYRLRLIPTKSHKVCALHFVII